MHALCTNTVLTRCLGYKVQRAISLANIKEISKQGCFTEVCCRRNQPNVLSQAHTHPQMLFRPDWPWTGFSPPPPPSTKQWYRQESTTQPTTCCSVKPCVWPSAAARRSAFYVQNSLPLHTQTAPAIQAGWRKFVKLLMLSVFGRAGGVLRGRAVHTGVGSCCQGRWGVIFSPLCLLPVGQGLLERGVADFRVKRRGGKSAA